MKSKLVSVLSTTLLLACAATEPQSRLTAHPDVRIEYSSPEEAMAALQANPNVSFREQNGWTVADDPQNHTLWTFTPEDHPAHPAVAKRVLYERDGGVWINTGLLCAAGPDICGQLVEDFRALDQQVRREFERRAQQ